MEFLDNFVYAQWTHRSFLWNNLQKILSVKELNLVEKEMHIKASNSKLTTKK